MRREFSTIFQTNTDGIIEPLMRVNINGVVFDRGTRFTQGVAFGGVDLHKFIGWGVEVDLIDEIMVIRGFYPPETHA